jgi:hypothetical protein
VAMSKMELLSLVRKAEAGAVDFGDRRIEVTPGDGPEIRIDGYSLFGDVKISDRPPA